MDTMNIIFGYLAWIGGDSAKLEIEDLVKLGLNENEINENIASLRKQGLMIDSKNKYVLTDKGRYAVDFSLLSIIAKWSYESAIWSAYPFETMQWIFARTERNSIKNIVNDIKGRYVLKFSQNFLTYMAKKLPGYSLADYFHLRKFVMKTSIYPVYDFVMKDIPEDMKLSLSYLFDEKILSTFKCSDLVITFNIKEYEEFAFKQSSQKNTK